MILVIGEPTDTVTDTTLDWLNHLGLRFVRTHCERGKSLIEKIVISDEETDVYLTIDAKSYKLSDFKFTWARRGYLDAFIPPTKGMAKENKAFLLEVQSHLFREREAMLKFIYDRLGNIPSLNNPLSYNVNKLWVLEKAKVRGLKIPETLITGSRSSIKEHLEEPVINKNIQDLFRVEKEGKYAFHDIQKIDCIAAISPDFYFSLFQKEIKKKIELRIFFVGEKYFSMAIFSQSNAKTKLDYRLYDDKKENRTVPYHLPEEQLNKLKNLMGDIGLNSGSIDMIVDENNDYIFLEVNPVGQFEWVSRNCNYFLEREIAKHINHECQRSD